MTKRKTIAIEKKGGFNRLDLLTVLDSLKPGLSNREETSYLFMKDRIATYNDELCLVADYPIGFEGSVRAEELYKLLMKTSAKEINLDLEEQQLKVKAGKSSFGLAYREGSEIQEKVESLKHKELKWRPLSKELKDAMVLCSFSASKDMTKPALTGVYVGGGEVLSSDNYRISWYKVEEGIRRSFLVPATSIVHLIGYEMKEYCLMDSWIHFSDGKLHFSARLLSEEFPTKAREFFPEETEEGFELPKELSGVLDKAMVLLQDDFLLDKAVKLTFTEKDVSCRVDKMDVGWFLESVPLERGTKGQIEIEINPVFLKEILKRTSTVSLMGEDKVLFTSGNFRHLIALG